MIEPRKEFTYTPRTPVRLDIDIKDDKKEEKKKKDSWLQSISKSKSNSKYNTANDLEKINEVESAAENTDVNMTFGNEPAVIKEPKQTRSRKPDIAIEKITVEA